MNALWTSEAAGTATGGDLIGGAWKATGVSIDSRTLEAGDLFVAIRGENSDGHSYVAKAFENGAAAAIVSDVLPEYRDLGPLLVVEDTQRALEDLGRASRARSTAKIVAITGSVGKTTTKEMMAAVLSRQGKTHWSVASYNNHWGVPLSLARMPADCDFGVFEIGMNHAGEIRPLVGMVRPHVAIITTVEAVHIEFFDSVEGIADAKAEILEGVEPGGTAILNFDNPHHARLKARADALGVATKSFGTREGADIRLARLVELDRCNTAVAEVLGTPVTYKLGLLGAHNAMNSLSVLGAVAALGEDLALAALTLATVKPPKGRGLRHLVATPRGKITVIDESYNANPASMRAAISGLTKTRPEARGRRIAVLGDMLELGSNSADMHRGLADAFEDGETDLVFAAGPDMAHLVDALPPRMVGGHAKKSAKLEPLLLNEIRDGDVVMVKGSLGSRMGPIVDALLAMGRPVNDELLAEGDA